MTRSLVIIGCGGFGREVHDIVDAINAEAPKWELLGYLDDSPTDVNRGLVERRGSTVLGGLAWLQGREDVAYAIGIGSGAARRAIDDQLSSRGHESATLVHPEATVGGDTRLGPGTIVCAGARLTTNISTGRHVHVNINSTVGHDALLEDYVTVNPLAAISGWVVIGTESLIGTTSCVLQNLTVGPQSTVGAGSCVVKPVPPRTIVKGVPAK